MSPIDVVDLTQPLGPRTVLWPGSTPFSATVGGRLPETSYWRDLELPEHAGTHLDAPAHFAPGGATADQLSLEQLVRPAAVLDARPICSDDPNAEVAAADLEGFEAAHGRLQAGDALLVCTGWDRYVNDDEQYSVFPGLSVDAAELVVERGVAGICIDTLGIEPRSASTFPAHRITQAAGVWHLEGLVGLERLPPRGAWIAAGVLPVVEGSGAPARAFAILT
jgi:kynurenine formamidase